MTGERYPLAKDEETGLWILPDPVACPNGHVLAEVGFQRRWTPCLVCGIGERAKGHMTWICGQCRGAVYDPPHELGEEQ